ncbi:hypothetical protein GACE_2284 [Geoglobus acetivorans]|uniref:Uncharacterized protein n=1 Tax=Geoglobus acetivorans TaxID=565033 RepID=A0A0A7GDX7_GEOAI|nr:hypothetical protein GACE_2284 [Geoglobus acetivorans]
MARLNGKTAYFRRISGRRRKREGKNVWRILERSLNSE